MGEAVVVDASMVEADAPHLQVYTYGIRMGAWLLGAPRAGQHVLTQAPSSGLGRQGGGLRMLLLPLLLLQGSGGGPRLRSSGNSNCGQRKQVRHSSLSERWLVAACRDYTRTEGTEGTKGGAREEGGDQGRSEGGGRGPREERGRREGTKGEPRACACMGVAWAVPLPG